MARRGFCRQHRGARNLDSLRPTESQARSFENGVLEVNDIESRSPGRDIWWWNRCGGRWSRRCPGNMCFFTQPSRNLDPRPPREQIVQFSSTSTRFPLSPYFFVRTGFVSGPRRSTRTKVVGVCSGIEFFCLTLTLNWEGYGETTPLMETGSVIQLEGRIVPRGDVSAFHAGRGYRR